MNGKKLFSVVSSIALIILSHQASQCCMQFGKEHLFQAVESGDHEWVKDLLKEQHLDVNVKNEAGETPLILATRRGDLIIMEELLEDGANVDAQDNKQLTALMWTSNNGDLAGTQKLLAYNPQVDITDENGDTALIKAILFRGNTNQRTNVVRELLKHGAQAERRNNVGLSAVDVAKRRAPEIVPLLKHDEQNKKPQAFVPEDTPRGCIPVDLRSVKRKQSMCSLTPEISTIPSASIENDIIPGAAPQAYVPQKETNPESKGTDQESPGTPAVKIIRGPATPPRVVRALPAN